MLISSPQRRVSWSVSRQRWSRWCSQNLDSLIPRSSKKNLRRVPGIYCSCMRGPQVFVGNLETTVILVRVAQPYMTGVVTSICSSTKPCRVPSVRLESQEWH